MEFTPSFSNLEIMACSPKPVLASEIQEYASIGASNGVMGAGVRHGKDAGSSAGANLPNLK